MLRAEFTEGGYATENPNCVYVLSRGKDDNYGIVAAFQNKEQADAWGKVLAPEMDELEYYVEGLPIIKPGVLPTIYTLYVAKYQGKVEDYRQVGPDHVRAQRTVQELDMMGLDEIVPARIRMEHIYTLPPESPLYGSMFVIADGTDPQAVLLCLHERMMELRKERGLDGRGETPDPTQPA